ncbi:T-lymphocyte activation antigen CD86 [Tupaia chinensis]|uniref:T-lymphocyte activation antigen CD86 n=1 Tax=Tupaia chinensis TaxID=246437 RepID=L8YBM3_TUPCH|nr:T-lymphocyte activation antigen CD86 [Tupaia chinensis]
MGLSSMLFTLAFLLSGAASLASQAYFNDVADLPCQFTNPQNISLGELVVFWQNQEMLVLYERYLGKDKLDNIDLKYLGRTSFDQDSWTLRLHNIQIKDKGSYQCFVHHKKPKGLVSIHQMTTDLSVLDPENQPLPDPPSPSTWFAIALVPLVIAPVIISQSLRKLKKKRKPGASYERGKSVLVLSGGHHFAAASQSAASGAH